MSTKCEKVFTLNITEGDTPLDQAIYSASQNAIYGVRGQWVYKFNATTGAKIAEAVVHPDCLGLMGICDFNGTIVVTVNFTQTQPRTAAVQWRNHDFFIIDPTTLAATNTDFWKNYYGPPDPEYMLWGPRNIISDGTRIWGMITDGGAGSGSSLFSVVPFAGVTIKFRTGWPNRGAWPAESDLIFESTSGLVFVTNPDNNGLDGHDMSGGFPPTPVAGMAGGFAYRPHGLCYCPANGYIYAVDGTPILISASVALMTTTGGINFPVSTGVAAANPRRIKYNPNTGMLLVPGWASNSIIVIDPLTNTVVEEKTGFTLPWDICIAGTKAFAIQNSAVGLKEII